MWGWGVEEGGAKRKVWGGGWSKRGEREGSGWEGEKDSSVSLTWQVYHTTQWGETWRLRPGDERGTEGHGKPRHKMWRRGWDGMGWVFFVVGACVRKAGVRWREGQVCTEGCGTTQCAKCVQRSKLIILRRLMIQLARLQNWHNFRHQWQSFPIAFIFLRLTVLTFSSRPPLFKLWNRWQHTDMYKATLWGAALRLRPESRVRDCDAYSVTISGAGSPKRHRLWRWINAFTQSWAHIYSPILSYCRLLVATNLSADK